MRNAFFFFNYYYCLYDTFFVIVLFFFFFFFLGGHGPWTGLFNVFHQGNKILMGGEASEVRNIINYITSLSYFPN